jgi:hypothetical protein
MAGFMVAPMVTWMRVRGCSWRVAVEMSGAMLLPIVAVIALDRLGLSDSLAWLSNSEHTAMLVGMLLFMWYRREHYTSGYSFRRAAAAAGGRSSDAQLADAEQPSARAAAR